MSQTTSPTLPAPRRRGRQILRGFFVITILGVAVGVWQRERLWIGYCGARLERANEADRRGWGDKLIAAGEPAVPTLLALLQHEDSGICAEARHSLSVIVSPWPQDDPRRAAFAQQLFETKFSPAGLGAALELLPDVMTSASPLAIEKARGLIENGVKSDSVDVRLQAIAVAFRPDIDHLTALVPLLDDPAFEVRQAAVLALGPVRMGAKPAIGDDLLLKRLHDGDEEVRRLAEMGLRSRGRSPRDIQLGRRYTAPEAKERQKLLLDLANEEELDVTVWLERLTQDIDPAVRAGAARVAADRRVDLSARLQQMSQTDPDGTVRQIAGFYHKKMMTR